MRPDITKRFENTFPHVLQDFDAYKQKFETTFPESPTVQKLKSLSSLFQFFTGTYLIARHSLF